MSQKIYNFSTESADLSDTTFVFTGHSRGAAIANIVAVDFLQRDCDEDQIRAYCFACPNTVQIEVDTAESYESIYNISNYHDSVTWIPGFDSSWNKYGNSYWYLDKKSKIDKSDIINQHLQSTYLDYLRNEYKLRKYMDKEDAQSKR